MMFESKNLEQTKEVAEKFLSGLSLLNDGATVVALHGDLGSGKTTFTQFVAQSLGVKEKVTSPTFVLIKNYKLKNTKLFSQSVCYESLFHIDAYRLNNGDDLKKLGWQEIVSNPKNLVLIEWPERVSGIIPENAIKIGFEFVDDLTRKIIF
jgi:tRNA threonylcarbamoyladenosine biosynthesis protein TsaE